MNHYEIIADPQEYGLEALAEGVEGAPMEFPADEREQWAREVGDFSRRLMDLSEKAQRLQQVLHGDDEIKATPKSLKTLKIQLFEINNFINASSDLVHRLEADVVPPIT